MADGVVTIAVELQDGSVVKGVADLKGAMQGFQGATDTSSSSMIKFGTITGAAMAAVSAGFNVVKESVSDAVARFDTLNQFPKVMKQMGFSAQDTAKATESLKKGVDGLPTSLSEITKSAQSFAILTGSADKGAKTAVALNNAFLASGASADDASRGVQQYSQMLSSGTVDMESWRTLTETMPYALNEVAKSFGFTGKSAKNDLYKALQDGSITMDQMNQKFMELNDGANGFAATAKTATAGIGTSFKNLKNATVKGLADTITAIDTGLTNAGLPNIAALIDMQKDNVAAAFKTFNAVVAVGVQGIATSIKFLYDFVNNNKDWIAPLVVGLAAGATAFGILKAAMNISGAVTSVISSISSMIETMQILWLLMLDNPIAIIVIAIAALAAGLTYFFTQTKTGQAAWSSFTSFLVSAWQSASTFISSAVQVINSAFQRMMDYISPLIGAISSWLGSLAPVGGVFAGISGPMGIVIGLIDKFGPLIVSLVAPIGIVGKLLLQFAAAFIQTGNASDAIGLMASNFASLVTNVLNGLTTVINGLTSMLPSIIQFGVDIITMLIQGLVSALPQIIQAMTGIITQLTGALTTALPIIVQGGIQLINGLMQAIVSALPALVQAFTDGIQSLVTGLTAVLPELVNGGVQIIMALLGAIVGALPMLIAAAVQIIMALVNGLIANLPQIINAGIQLITALLNAFVTMLPLLINAAVQIIMALVNGLIANLPQIINAAIQLITALVNGFITMLPMLITAAIQIIMALVNGLIQNLPQIINAGVQLIMALINGLIQVLPQLVMAAFQLIVALVGAIIQMVPQLLAAGVQLIMALISGIGSLLGTLIQAGANLIVQMLSAIGGFLGNMGSMGSNLITSLIGGISGLIGNVASTVGKGVSNAVNSVKDFFGDMKEAAGYMVSGLVKGIEDKISDVVNAAKDMGKKAVEGVKSFLNIHSPSRVMRDEVGQYIPLGVAAGIDRYSDKAVDSMKAMSRKLTMVKPSATIDFGAQGGLTQARQIMQNQLSISGDDSNNQTPVSNTAEVNITNIVRDNPSEVEQARITRNEMRKMGYDLAY
ncbi:hypothetical protein ESZ50_08040 [Weissella muntiaci]|uniref:Tape measure protein N-terminal domain-containing protein n=1 Tax=Weissella muntiaci TaxID=2508881 RepID=A0A6C2C587_9LACO|nr:tape measure protein [Weissella muntiaci]TYC48819.1 hypothetical protein ESZ50_08040 [Weissella muntiaci]